MKAQPFFAVVLLVLSWAASAQVGTAPSPAAPASSGGIEVAVLRAQLEETRHFQEQILSTVYWSLGTIGALAAAIVGFGWFANFKVYERDKVSMQAEVTQTAKAAFLAYTKTVDERLGKVADEVQRKTLATFTSKMAGLEERMTAFEYADLLRQYRAERPNNIPRNSLQAAITLFEAASKLRRYAEGRDDALDAVASDVDRILDAQRAGVEGPIDTYLMNQLFTVMNSAPEDQQPVAKQIAARATAIKTGG